MVARGLGSWADRGLVGSWTLLEFLPRLPNNKHSNGSGPSLLRVVLISLAIASYSGATGSKESWLAFGATPQKRLPLRLLLWPLSLRRPAAAWLARSYLLGGGAACGWMAFSSAVPYVVLGCDHMIEAKLMAICG